MALPGPGPPPVGGFAGQGVGELFGSSFDDVLRHPKPFAFPLTMDVLSLAVAVVLFTALASLPAPPAERSFADLAFSVPAALPTLSDAFNLGQGAALQGPRGVAAEAAWLLAILPFIAWAEGGFIGVLRSVYVEGRARRDAFPPPDSYGEMAREFTAAAKRAFPALFVLRSLQVVVTLGAFTLPERVPYFRNYALGLMAFDFLLIFAPYIVVLEGAGPFQALRQSVATIADFLASSLVVLLFALLTTGGMGVLLAPLLGFAGPPGIFLAAVLYAPVGAALSLFLLKAYLSFRPVEPLGTIGPMRTDVGRPAEGA